jgi:5-methylcytosine-specific restriction endonuclease McrA
MIKLNYNKSTESLKNELYELIAINRIYNGKTNFIKKIKILFQETRILKKGKNKGNKKLEYIKDINLEKIYNILIEKNDNFKIFFNAYTLKKLITANPNELKEIIVALDKKCLINKDETKNNLIEFIFNYTDNQKDYLTPFFQKCIESRTCFYCNKDFITDFILDKKISTFQLDHFYDKGKYPYLALSFYNLIPSCTTCNSSKVKGSLDTFKHDKRLKKYGKEHETCLAPNNKNFDFNKKVKFKLFLSDKCKNLNIKDKNNKLNVENIEIPLKENYSNEYEKYIEVFKLNERYKAHKNIVIEMIEKAELYPESRLKELQDLTGIPFQQIKKDIFNLIDENEDLSKQPFSKLIKDISEELKLI